MKVELLALGELIADFLPYGKSEQGYPIYEWNPGGAPANIAAAARKLGLKSGMIGKLGNDPIGRMLRDEMERRGVNCDGLSFDGTSPTALSVVHLSDGGERSFSFFGDPPADMALTCDDLPYALLSDCRMLHFGARSLIAPTAREATLKAVAVARESGALISFDPNLRPALWKDGKSAANDALLGVGQADFVKLSLEEMRLVYATDDVGEVLGTLAGQGKTCVVTDGKNGAFVWENGAALRVPSYSVRQVDSTGAGDAFWAAFLYQCLTAPEAPASRRVGFANAAGALACTRKGAMTAHPATEEILRFLTQETIR